MKKDRRQFRLSAEAEALLTDGSGRWERLDLADGPAAQAMVEGVKARPYRPAPVVLDLDEGRDDLTADLFY